MNFTVNTWPVDFMPLSEAADILCRVLASSGANGRSSAKRDSELRALLTNVDGRFDKNNNPSACTPGLITLLTEYALAQGLIVKFLNGKGLNYSIFLSSKYKQSDLNKNQERRFNKLSRSGEFIETLKSLDLGPFSTIRPTLFEGLSSILENNKDNGITVNELAHEAVSFTKTRFENSNLIGCHFPWRRVRQFLVNILSRNAVLLNSENTPINAKLSTLSTKVYSLIANWEIILESDLVCILIQYRKDISISDMQQISGALHLKRDKENENYIVSLLEFLHSNNKIKEVNGLLQLTTAE